jgi:outer membrane lipopolysaccharide assembly protein LptE/RlpB
MLKKTFIVLLFSLILSGCGYVSIYKNTGQFNYKVLIVEHTGDRDMKNLINSQLKKYSEIESDKIFKIKINTNYEKNITAKDTAGKATDYQIRVTSNFNVEQETINKIIKINETFNVKAIDNKFKEQEYDLIIKNNIANTIAKRIILQLSRN